MGNPLSDMHLDQKHYWEILRKQLSLHGTWNSSYTQKRNDWQTAIDSMAAGRLNVKPFITHRFELGDCNKAFLLAKDKTEFYNKIMLIHS